MLRRLDGVEGIPRLVPGAAGRRCLAFVDTAVRAAGRAALAVGRRRRCWRWRTGWPASLAAVHRRGVVHRDINPANILVPLVDGPRRPSSSPSLIDFELATTLAEDRFAPVTRGQVAGTLPYLAPEQTGRTGRPVDQRADLYALGATLYELATGRAAVRPGRRPAAADPRPPGPDARCRRPR